MIDLYVVTHGTKDYGDLFVLRNMWIDHNGLHGAALPRSVGPTLESVQQAVPPGLMRCEPHPDDDPVIVEFWME